MAATAVQFSPLSLYLHRELLNHESVTKLSPCRRFTTLFASNSPLDYIYYLASGLAKVSKEGAEGKEIIVNLVGPGELFGEQALLFQGTRGVSAQMIENGSVYLIPLPLFVGACERVPVMWKLVADLALRRQRELERKLELVCLKDVEQRILLTLADLSQKFNPDDEVGERTIPLSQSELASLIGATRETTSTTLNALERRGLVQLGRRMLAISSLDAVTAATRADGVGRAMTA